MGVFLGSHAFLFFAVKGRCSKGSRGLGQALDYEDFLRQHKLRAWSKNDPEALEVRAVGKKLDRSDQPDRSDPVVHWQAYAHWLEHADSAVVANTLLCLIHQTNYLLDRQINALERDFVEGGGYSEQLAVARIAERKRQRENPTDPTDPSDKAPDCPLCGKPLVLRTARQGPRAGSQFWGCSGYPECKGTRSLP